MATIGYDGITPAFNSSTTVASLRRAGTKFSAVEAGTITDISMRMDNQQDELMVEVFVDVAGEPGARLGNTPPQQVLAPTGNYVMSWSGLSIPFSAGAIWLCFHSNTAFTSNIKEFDGGGAQYRFKSGVAFTDPCVDPFGTPDGSDDRLMAIWATYTPSSIVYDVDFPPIISGRGAC